MRIKKVKTQNELSEIEEEIKFLEELSNKINDRLKELKNTLYVKERF